MFFQSISKYRSILVIAITILLTVCLFFSYSSLELYNYKLEWKILLIPTILPILMILIDIYLNKIKNKEKHFSKLKFIVFGLMTNPLTLIVLIVFRLATGDFV